MAIKIEVLYNGALAHYEVRRNLLGSYSVSLSYYEGNGGGGQPPSVITVYIHANSCLGNPGNQDLLDDIGLRISEQKH
ncbi:hypothetical protein V9K67_26255 [Paraflavisolibacter sp. H34]|uniref:hypothetical protein n=1 Tax=Huijunlia imazamoxiresistens TaxID=3127457 RepID=UPI0030192653